MEPITLFSRLGNPALVAALLREIAPSAEFDGPEDDWRRAVVRFGAGRKARTLTFTFDPDYCAERNLSEQMSGMRGYFSGFPESPRKPRTMALTTTFRFCLGTLSDPGLDPAGDPRWDVLFAVAERLDAVLFTMSALRDARGRVLFGVDGDDDPQAVWPRVAAQVPVSEPLGAALHAASRPASGESLEEAAPDADPPKVLRVRRRALALAAVTARAILEQDAAEPAARGTWRDLQEWTKAIGIDSEFEPAERNTARQPLGKLDQRSQVNSTWRLEGLAVLAWALGRFEIPPHDELVQPNLLWRSLGLLDASAAKQLLAAAALRPRAEIGRLRNRLFALHWRLRDFHVTPKAMDFAAFAKDCWFGPLDIDGLPLVGGDLALGGTRIDQADPDLLSTAQSAAMERHLAANWLWEGPSLYSDASQAT